MVHVALLSRNLSTHSPHRSMKHASMPYDFFRPLNVRSVYFCSVIPCSLRMVTGVLEGHTVSCTSIPTPEAVCCFELCCGSLSPNCKVDDVLCKKLLHGLNWRRVGFSCYI
jgi:hypothetical protein